MKALIWILLVVNVIFFLLNLFFLVYGDWPISSAIGSFFALLGYLFCHTSLISLKEEE